MRRIGLFILCLVCGLAVAQSDNDVATLYANADIVFTGLMERINPSSTGLSAQFKVTKLIKGRAVITKTIRAELPSESRCHSFE
jgi:hypothetical protein